MKLLIILSVIAYSYADKLDRTYLPPENAGTAGGSPGSIAAPGTGTELGVPKGSFGQPSGSSFEQPSGPSFDKPSGSTFDRPSSFGQPSRPSFGQPSQSSFGQPSGSSFDRPSGSSFEQPSSSSFGKPSSTSLGQPSGSSFGQPSLSPFGKPSLTSNNDLSGSNFGQGQNQDDLQSGLTQSGQSGANLSGSQYNQAGPTGNTGSPGFDQTGTGFNKSPTFGNSQRPSYTRPVQPDRARASIDRNAEILHYENNNDGNTFSYNFETSNGIAAGEAGVATHGVRAEGGYSYTGDDGQLYSVRYTADENGYIPQGDHLPTPHPIPEEILKSLEENARAAAAGTQEGAYNPNEDSGLNNDVPYSGQDNQSGHPSDRYQPGQDSPYGVRGTSSTAVRPEGNQVLSSKNNAPATPFGFQGNLGSTTPEYEAPTSSPTRSGSQRFPSQNIQRPVSQYRVPESSPTASTPSSQHNDPTTPPFGTRLGSQGGKYSTSQYNGNLDTPRSDITDTSQPISPSLGVISSMYDRTGLLNINQQGSRRPGSQILSSGDSGKPGLASKENNYYTPGSSQSGYQYNNPNTISGEKRFGSQTFPSQANSSPASQYNKYTGTTSGSNALNGPQPFSSETLSGPEASRPYNSQSPTSNYNTPGSSPFSSLKPFEHKGFPVDQSQPQYNTPGSSSLSTRPGSQEFPSNVGSSPASQYGDSAGSPFSTTALSGSQDTSSKISSGLGSSQSYGNESPTSNYNAPGLSSFGAVKPTGSQGFPHGQSQPESNQRPQFGFPSRFESRKPTVSSTNKQNTQEQDESGYKYSRPQNQFIGEQGNELPSGSRFSSATPTGLPKPVGQGGFIGNGVYRGPSTSQDSTSATAGGNYNPSGPSSNDQNSLSNTGQYTPERFGSRPTISPFTRPNSSVGSFGTTNNYQSTQTPGSTLSMPDSAPYQYNRPEPSGFGPSGQNRPGQIASQPGFNSARQETPGQVNSQPTYGSPGQKRPTQVGSQSNFSPDSQNRPSQNAFGSYGQKKPVETGSLSTVGLSQQDRPSQTGIYSGSGNIGENRPGQSNIQPGFGYSGQKQPGQNGSPSVFGPFGQDSSPQGEGQGSFGITGQNVSNQSGNQFGFDNLGQNSPNQVGSQSPFGSGQKRPGQTGVRPGYDLSNQDRPGQIGTGKPEENFGGPRQPPSFTQEEGYKY